MTQEVKDRLEYYYILATKIRETLSCTIEGKTSGRHTEVHIHNKDRNNKFSISERATGVDEPFHETFIRCAERLLSQQQ